MADKSENFAHPLFDEVYSRKYGKQVQKIEAKSPWES